MDLTQLHDYLSGLQARIVEALETFDGSRFRDDVWERPGGGGGRTRILEEGGFFERAGVGFSQVNGDTLPGSASAAHPGLAGRGFEAIGISLVLHPRNPYCPTVHMNLRFFHASARAEDDEGIWWFGGGTDLTPYYPFEEDVRHFHARCKAALDPFGPDLHRRFKQACDRYFFIRHRDEPRGVGGIFFDDFSEGGFERSFALVRSVGDAFLDAYLPIVGRRRAIPWGDRERDFQAFRRGRYVEFNLVQDRGTLFGLQSGGRAESILMSLPPLARWRYDWKPEPGSPEEALYRDFLPPRDWV